MKYSIITLVNDLTLYENNTEKSLVNNISKDFELKPVVTSDSAAYGLNAGIAGSKGKIIICCHQDILFDADFLVRVDRYIKRFPEFGIFGLAGITEAETAVGSIRFPDGTQYTNSPESGAICIDELCMIFRRDSGLKFDELFTGFHFYGADLSLQSMWAGLDNICIDAGAIHLSRYGDNINKKDYFTGLKRLRDKWVKKIKRVRTNTAWYEGNKFGTYIKGL